MKGLNAPLIEYLYVDGVRLDRYFEQLSGPVTFEKVPTFVGSVGMTGPSASVSQAAHGREFTRYEKIAALEAHLNEGGYLGTGRPDEARLDDAEKIFRSEVCKATRVLIPNDQAPLALWICDSPDAKEPEDRAAKHSFGRVVGPLYLIEDFRPADLGSPVIRTSYSTLRMLVEQVADSELEAKLSNVPDEADPGKLFSRRPFELVEKLGGKVGDPRTIKALYRIRATLVDQYRYPEQQVVTIGYPIVVEEAAARRSAR
jgi:hypothetical protein